jgi:hypothetical protein
MTKIEDQGMDFPVVYQNEENLYIVPFLQSAFILRRDVNSPNPEDNTVP